MILNNLMANWPFKLNHRKILDGVLEVCGVPPEKICTISSAVDKLDKVNVLKADTRENILKNFVSATLK